jgi:hypothetical protein
MFTWTGVVTPAKVGIAKLHRDFLASGIHAAGARYWWSVVLLAQRLDQGAYPRMGLHQKADVRSRHLVSLSESCNESFNRRIGRSGLREMGLVCRRDQGDIGSELSGHSHSCEYCRRRILPVNRYNVELSQHTLNQQSATSMILSLAKPDDFSAKPSHSRRSRSCLWHCESAVE